MRAVAICLVTVTLLSCRAGRKESNTDQVRVATLTGVSEHFYVYLARELGYFRDQGLEVHIDEYPSGAKIIESLVGGSSDVACGDYMNSLVMAAQGRQLKTFVLTTTAHAMVLVVSPGGASRIRRIEDLKGAVIGLAGFGSSQHRILEYLAARHGVPFGDMQVVIYGSGPSAIAALEHGKAGAGMINGSAFNVLKRRAPGIRVLADARTREGLREIYGTDAIAGLGVFATTEWLTRHPDKARRVARAMVDTLRWVRAHSAADVRARLPQQFRTENESADLETLGDAIAVSSPDGLMPPGAAEAVYKVISVSMETLRAAKIDVGATYTNEFVKGDR